jgi:indole-3-glycerol phosphate synthase
MSEFLTEMAKLSQARSDEAQAREPRHALARRAQTTPRPPTLSTTGFVLIAEVKRSSPSEGVLAVDDAPLESVVSQAQQYVAGGAHVISVLTEPTKFGGDLSHLSAVARAVSVPVMRKDFLTTPYQVYEARAAGAAGVLVIVRMLDDATLRGMLEATNELGLFILFEAFNKQDFDRLKPLLEMRPKRYSRHSTPVMVGLNTRDLATLKVDPRALVDLAPHFPPGLPRIAESGIEGAADVARCVGLGYSGALVGTALMRSDNPAQLCREMLEAAQGIRPRE